jgi:hypothetical protein
MDVLVQVDAKKDTHIALAARLGIAPPTFKTTVKNRKDTKKLYTQCGRFSGQRKSLIRSPFQELDSLLAVWFRKLEAEMQ